MITAEWNNEARQYTVKIDARTAHILIWGGYQSDVLCAERDLRNALVEQEDNAMPDSVYTEMFEAIYG